MATLCSFLDSNFRNQWVRYGPADVYVRKGNHILNGELLHTFDIANINIANEEQQQKGVFTAMVCELRELLTFEYNEYHALYVENVQTKYFANHLRRRGWIECAPIELPSFFMTIREKI